MTARRFGPCASIAALALALLAACSEHRDDARKMLSDIEAALSFAGPDAVKYAPEQLHEVQTKLGGLQAAFDKKDYAAVETGAPPVLDQALALASAAAAKKAELLRNLSDQWNTLAGTIPDDVTSIQSRIESLSKKANRRRAGGVDLEAARSALGAATSLWSKAQGAFGNANMQEAVDTAKQVKTQLEALAATMSMDLAAPAPPPARAGG